MKYTPWFTPKAEPVAVALSEINVKNIEYLDSANLLLVKELKPNFKTLGPRFGNKLNKIVAEIKELDPEKFNEDKGVEINVDKE